jgi:cell volume regulation protein A
MGEGLFVLAAGVLVAGTLAASIVAEAFRLPALVLFMGVGMLAGSDGVGLIHFDDYDVARQIGTAALSLILFQGGLTTSFADLRQVLRPAIGLALVGTLVTAVLAGLAATVLLGLSPLHGLLLGSIVASTDGAAVFAMLRGSVLPRRLVHTLEGEAGLNDPVAVLLVLGFIDVITKPAFGFLDMVGLFVNELGLGAIAGLLVARAAAEAMRRLPLPGAGMYPAGTLATAAMAYGAAETLGGSGFLAVYLAGLTLSNTPGPAQMTITIFHQGAAWFAQVALFLTLGLLVFPSQLGSVWMEGTLLSIFLMFVARPVAVSVATALDGFTKPERMLLSWAGMRGGVAVVLATFPVLANVSGSMRFFNVVFLVVVITTLVQGMTFEPLARRLGLEGSGRAATAPMPVPAAPVPAPAFTAPAPTVSAPTASFQSPQSPTSQMVHGAWSPAYGDPSHPVRLHDHAVVEHIRVRRDAAGALVRLQDGRHAITGATLTVGHAADLRRYVAARLAKAVSDDERAWWTALAVTLARSS